MTEVVSILVRKHNSGRLTGSTFQQALGEFRAEINTGAPIRVVGIVGVEAESAYDFVERHFVNSTDAILLRTALDLATALRARGDDLLLVTSDRRLLRAARAEGADSLRPGAAILR